MPGYFVCGIPKQQPADRRGDYRGSGIPDCSGVASGVVSRGMRIHAAVEERLAFGSLCERRFDAGDAPGAAAGGSVADAEARGAHGAGQSAGAFSGAVAGDFRVRVIRRRGACELRVYDGAKLRWREAAAISFDWNTLPVLGNYSRAQ